VQNQFKRVTSAFQTNAGKAIPQIFIFQHVSFQQNPPDAFHLRLFVFVVDILCMMRSMTEETTRNMTNKKQTHFPNNFDFTLV
jgi:hypothetical protein